MSVGIIKQKDNAYNRYRVEIADNFDDAEILTSVDIQFKGKTPTGLSTPHDAIILTRPAHRNNLVVTEAAHKSGIEVYADIDDDIPNIVGQHGAFQYFHPKYSEEYNWDIWQEVCRRADRVICSTEALADRYGNGNGYVARNYIPEWYLDIEQEKIEGSVGYLAHIPTHPGDLDTATAGIESSDGELYHMGGGEPLIDHHDLNGSSLREYLDHMASMSVAVVPLRQNKFNRAKSWLKGLEAMAVGTPAIATPTLEYQKLAEDTPLRLADKTRKWRSRINETLGTTVDRSPLKRYTIDNNLDEWARAWSVGSYKK